MAAHHQLSNQFHPDSLGVGEETTVSPDELLHPQIIRDERDPKLGGIGGGGMNQRGMDAMVPGHRLNMSEDQFADTDAYFSELAHSMVTHGQQQPLMLHRQPSGIYWLGEGNNRLAAARRHGIGELRVKRGQDAKYEVDRDYPARVTGRG